ncbi:unnamed protein product [Microthlaspi erraticum]|uniref:Uncharacterized protein n=1 Tax=Microthlaspi erraticum TaxID=1685480 RepID=A0A6D2K004_9BRAS|nr:unnamed protein product [Microthlaspi erraticum]
MHCLSDCEVGLMLISMVFWSILEHMGREEHGGTWHGRSSTGYAKEEGEAILKTSSTNLEFLNSTGQASTRSS